jgi:hypothetical protein
MRYNRSFSSQPQTEKHQLNSWFSLCIEEGQKMRARALKTRIFGGLSNVRVEMGRCARNIGGYGYGGE